MSSPQLSLESVVNDHDGPVSESRPKVSKKRTSKERRMIRNKARAVLQTSSLLAETRTIDLQHQNTALTIQTRQDKTRIVQPRHDNSKLSKLVARLCNDLALMRSDRDDLNAQLESITASTTSAQQTNRARQTLSLPVDRSSARF